MNAAPRLTARAMSESSRTERRRWVATVRGAGPVLALLTFGLLFGVSTPGFLTPFNLLSIVVQSATNAVVALGMTFVIISGGIDLSVGSVVALVAAVTASLMQEGVAVPVAVGMGLSLGTACGIVNGLLVARVNLQPFIVTLGTMSLFRGITLVYTNGYPILQVPASFKSAFAGAVGPFPMPVLIVVSLGALAGLVLRQTVYGEYVQAVGGNEHAARLAGVPVARIKVMTYGISGLLSAVSALVLVARLGAAEPNSGQGWELDAIAAAAIGGASLMGGKGSILGTVVGALLLGTLRNGLTLLNVQSFYQMLATGVIIVLAALIDKLSQARR